MATTALLGRDRASNLMLRLPNPRLILARWLVRGVNWSLDEWDRVIDMQTIGKPTTSGTNVSEHNSLQVSAVWACTKVLSEDIGHLPCGIFEWLPTGGRRRVPAHPVDRMLSRKANSEMAAITLRETMQGHLALWGNAYAEIVRDKGGHAVELWPLRPDRMVIRRTEQKELVYDYTLPNGQTVRFSRSQILHIPGWGFDGLRGYSPIAMARETIGLSKALKEFAGSYFGNGAHPGGIIEYPGKLSDTGREQFRKSTQEAYGGLGKFHRLMVLEQGLKYTQVGIPPEDSQFLETQQFQTVDIARFFRMQPHKIMDLSRSTNNNIEHQGIEHVTDTLMPWLVLWEQATAMQLLTDQEQERYYVKHNVAALLRGDTLSRFQAYAVGRQWGWLSANDVRRLEDADPIDGGDQYLVPLNMVPAGESGGEGVHRLARYVAGVDMQGRLQEPRPREHEETGTDDVPAAVEQRTQRSAAARRRLANSYRRVISEAVARIIRRERADIMREAERLLRRRDLAPLQDFIRRFYEQHREYVGENMLPALLAEAEAIQAEVADEIGVEPGVTPEMEDFARSYLAAYVARHIGSSEGQLLAVIGEASTENVDVLGAMQARFDEWQQTRPGRVAAWESTQLANAVSKAVFAAAGVNVGLPPLHEGRDYAIVAEAGSRGRRPDAAELRAVLAAIIRECGDVREG